MSFLKALFSLIFLLGVLGLGAGVAGYVWLQNELEQPGASTTKTLFTVEQGEGLGTVAAQLESAGLISDARLLRIAARLGDSGGLVKAGEYNIEPGLSIRETLARLIEGKTIQHRITVPEGLTVAQALRVIAGNEILVGDMPADIPAEGSLLPDTYFFGRGMTRAALIAQMEKAQDDLLAELWPGRQAELPLQTAYEAVILASIVEKETGLAAEREQIAGLFVGRMKRGMRLESDPTIIYGVSGGEPLLNRQGQRRTLYRSEIDRQTDWNTYQIDGLPKTPICNPGRDAIAAVLNPPETEFVFFVADGEGGHRFAKTLAEHNRNVAAYRAYERREQAAERAN